MSLKYEEIQIPVRMGEDPCNCGHVWERDSGNLVIVVIDDFWDNCLACSEEVDVTHRIFPLLKKYAFTLPDTHAIGFFPLAADEEGADKVLEYIQKWLEDIGTEDTRVYFLVDVMSGNPDNPELAYRCTKDRLECLYEPEHVRNLTGAGGTGKILDPDTDFVKSIEAAHIQRNKKFSPKFMKFLGIGLHEDLIIDAAIQFYGKAWETNWNPQGWAHDYLEGRNRDSPHLQALAEWLGDPVSIDDLVSNETDQTESAKSLMIWDEEDLWGSENPPWSVRDRRPIKGKVLNAVLRKLGIPLSETHPIPDERLITMPCVPCFPFLVSLRGFLWRCEEEEKKISVSEMCFFQLGENPQVNIFRLVLPLRDPAMLAKKFFGIGEERAGAFTNSLRDLTCCKTDGLTGHGDYIPLFGNGTESPVVAVEIAPGQINLIWSVR